MKLVARFLNAIALVGQALGLTEKGHSLAWLFHNARDSIEHHRVAAWVKLHQPKSQRGGRGPPAPSHSFRLPRYTVLATGFLRAG